jgi:type IV secretory pathway VirD2 relaxase
MFHAGRGAGYGALPDHARQQRVAVLPQPFPNTGKKDRGWFKHGGYLQREGAQRAGRGLGFDREQEDVSMSQTLGRWQQAGDPRLYTVIVSPERGGQMDLTQFTRRVMAQVDKDLGVTTQWAAIAHTNTRTRHIHLVIRSRDTKGHELWMDSSYLWGGIRQRAREIATQMVGLRTQWEIDREREHAVRARGWTLLDAAIRRKMPGRVEHDRPLNRHEGRRLGTLQKRGLAAKDGAGRWQLAEGWEEELKKESEREKEQKAPTQERQRDEQQKQRQRIIREHEEDEWER